MSLPTRFLLVCLCLLARFASAGLVSGDTIVVFNSNPQVRAVSEAVADYYMSPITGRGIPEANKIGVDCPVYDLSNPSVPLEAITPQRFYQSIQLPLEQFLHDRFHSDEVPIGEDPIKTIVTCYGIPSRVQGGEVRASVDAKLSLLFDSTPWGNGPLTLWADNPYRNTGDFCLNRSTPAEFDDFRRSSSNDVSIQPPPMAKVRMLDDTHAIAGSDGFLSSVYPSALYRGERIGGVWEWVPVADGERGSTTYNVTDICVADPQHYWVATAGGTVLEWNEQTQTWQTIRTASLTWYGTYDQVTAVSFNGEVWITVFIQGVYPNPEQYTVQKHEGGLWISARGDLPPDFKPKAVAAVDQWGVWVSGDSDIAADKGIWRTVDGGQHWLRCILPGDSAVGKLAVRKVGENYTGWAVRSDGAILHTTDGTTWSVLSSPSVPSGSAYLADLSVYDQSHITIAYGSPSFLMYDGSSWTTQSTATMDGKPSVAWAGGDFLAASGTGIRCGRGWPASLTWSQSLAPSPAHVGLRYLVCRLDAYSEPLDGATQIPLDVKNMIDSSVRASLAGPPTDGRFVLDDGGYASFGIADCLRNLPGGRDVTHSTGSAFLTFENDVIGYGTGGSYDAGAADDVTTWCRPFHSWHVGAIGLTWAVSGDGRTLRSPQFVYRPRRADEEVGVEQGYLKVKMISTYGPAYRTHWLRLYSSAGGLLGQSQFNASENQDEAIAKIDLPSVIWPTNHLTYFRVEYPDNDPQYPGEYVRDGKTDPSLDIYDAYSSAYGLAYKVQVDQSLAIELVHEGCAGVTGNVSEPGWAYCDPQPILMHYAAASTWGESAYMGVKVLGVVQVVVGDPLMAPYATPPNVSFTGPQAGETIYGNVPISVAAESVPNPVEGIKRVEFWLTNGNTVYKHVGSVESPPFNCMLDTSTVPDGTYKLRAVAYENNAQGEAAECLRQITIANSSKPTEISITNPGSDYETLTGSAQLEAQATNSPAVTQVDFWLAGDGECTLVGSDSSSPYSCSFDTSSYEAGLYRVYAVANVTGGSVGSPPRQVLIGCQFAARVPDARKLANGSHVYIGPKPVVAGAMGGAFYIEEEDRSAGLRVAWSGSVEAGKLATILGTIGNNSTTGEREITAEQVWLGGDAPDIAPVFMIHRSVGGEAPTDEPYTNAVTGTFGLYNTGMLVRVVGKVVYVGTDFIYVDDGSSLQDGNTIEMPVKVPLDGSTIPGPVSGVPGLKVYFGTVPSPGIDDYVSVTGISSLEMIGSNYVRCAHVRSQSDVARPHYYTNGTVVPAGIKGPDGSFLETGDRVRLADKCIYANLGSYFWGVDTSNPPTSCVFNVLAETAVVGDPVNCSPFTVTGTVAVDNVFHQVLPDAVYLGGSGSGAGGGNMNTSSLGNANPFSASSGTGTSSDKGPFDPWPGATAEEVMATDWFNSIFYRPGSVGWALRQPDGTVVSLTGQLVLLRDGDLYGIKETCDPIPNAPRLYLKLGYQPATEIVQAQIDIVNGMITTLGDGKRAIVKPEAVYLYANQKGRPYATLWLKSTTPEAPWPWVKQVYP